MKIIQQHSLEILNKVNAVELISSVPKYNDCFRANSQQTGTIITIIRKPDDRKQSDTITTIIDTPEAVDLPKKGNLIIEDGIVLVSLHIHL